MQRNVMLAAAAAAALYANQLPAAVIFWKGGTGSLTDANYTTDNVDTVAPIAGDVVNFGEGGVATHSTTALSLGKLRVGHNETNPVSGLNGTGAVTINNGAVVELTGGAAGAANAALWVGNVQNGTLTIDNATLTANRLVVVGIGNNINRNGTLDIKNGGVLNITQGNLILGDRAGSSGNGVQGHVTISGDASRITFADSTADLNIGARSATGTFTMTDGTVSGGDAVEIGMASSDGDGTTAPIQNGATLSISGGSITHGGNFFIGRGTTNNATLKLSGTGVINTGGLFLLGAHNSTGAKVDQTGGTLEMAATKYVVIADAFTDATKSATYELSDGTINSPGGMVVGRQGTGTMNQHGGTVNLGGALTIGDRQAAALAANGVYEISDGELVVNNLAGNAISIGTKGTGEFRVVGGDATIDLNGNFANRNTADGAGTLAFELQAGELFSVLDVSGTATFDAGSALVFDLAGVTPTQSVYDLLTASSIVDNGLTFSGPAGWSYQIVSGGNGQVLQVAVPEPSGLALLGAAGLLAMRRRRG